MSEVKRFKFINGVGNWSHEEAVLVSDHDRIVAELKAEIERLKMTVANNRLEHEWPIVKQLHEAQQTIAKQAKVIDRLSAVLEAVRSQMCWERDRDQLSMGMTSLHDDVTKALEKK